VARESGLGSPTGIGIGREASGLVPTRAWYDAHEPGKFTLGQALNTVIGQGDVRVTPLQLAVGYAAIANGGTVFEPRVVLRTEGPEGEAVAPSVRRKLEVPDADLARVRAALGAAVTGERGVAHALHDGAA